MIRPAIIVAFLAPNMLAAETQVRPAPAYYIDALINTTTAQQLALACPTLSVNLPKVAEDTGIVIAKLEEDGFTMVSEQTGMADATDELAQEQDAFVLKHGLQRPSQTLVCAAGKAEIVQDTIMGSYLIEVQP